MNETIYILLPVHNRCEVTRRFIECLNVQTYRNFHLILIDDGSSDGTADMVKESISSLTVIRGTGNWWWAGSLQQGYLWLEKQNISPSDLVLIINDDTEFANDFLEQAVFLFEEQGKMLLLSQCYSKQSGRLIDAGVRVNWRRLTFAQAASPEEINCLSTRGLFLRAGDFFAIGGFYPSLLPHYASDYEFTIRAERRGMRLTSHPSLFLVADEETTGYHAFIAASRSASLRRLFTCKSVNNPLVWSIFILLACPWPWKLVSLGRIVKGFMSNLCEIFRMQSTSMPN